MTSSGAVLALVLAETAAGGVGFLFLTPLWTEVRRGFFYLTGAVIALVALGAAGAASGGFTESGAEAGRQAVVLALVLGGATLLWLALLRAGQAAVARVLGIVTVPLAAAMLALFARATGEPIGLSLFQLLAGAVFTGAVLDGLLLGHWYLTDRRLTRAPINRMAWLLLAAVALEAAAVLAGAAGGSPDEAPASLNPLLFVAGSATWIAFGFVACTGLIAAFIRLTLRGTRPSAVQSATGFFYLAVLTAFTAEVAAKMRFLR